MQVGIIAEGPADVAVLTNILKGALGLNSADVLPLRPDLQQDETDAHTQPEQRFSNFDTVIAECKAPLKIEDFLSYVEADRLVIVHLDTAEAYRLSFDPEVLTAVEHASGSAARGGPDPADVALHRRFVLQIGRWVGPRFQRYIRHAIAVHEMDAWVLPLHETGQNDTSSYRDVKGRLDRALARADIDKRKLGRTEYDIRHKLSKELGRRKVLLNCAARNFSLRLFYEELTAPNQTVPE